MIENKNEKIDRVVQLLIWYLNPVFIYMADHTKSEGVLDIAYYLETKADVYQTHQLEMNAAEIMGVPVEINNLWESDLILIGDILESGEMVFCRSESERERFFADFAYNVEMFSMKRRIMISRMKECASIWEQ